MLLISLLLCERHEKVQRVVKRWLQSLPSLLLRLKDTPALTEFVLGILKKAVVQGVLKPDANFSSNLSIFFCECFKWSKCVYFELTIDTRFYSNARQFHLLIGGGGGVGGGVVRDSIG